LNSYTVVKAFGGHLVGETIMVYPALGAKLIKQGLVTLADRDVNEQVQFRWVNENLEIYNILTGAVLLRIPPAGLTSLSVDIVGDVIGNLFGDVTTYEGDGEIGLNLLMAILNGNAATCAMTLADGAEGQTITIKTVDITNDCTITPAHLQGGTSISLPAANDAVTLMFDGATNWHVINLYGTAAVVA